MDSTPASSTIRARLIVTPIISESRPLFIGITMIAALASRHLRICRPRPLHWGAQVDYSRFKASLRRLGPHVVASRAGGAVEISCITTLQNVKWASSSDLLISGQLARPSSRGTETGRSTPAIQSTFTSRDVCRSLKTLCLCLAICGS